MRTSTGLLAILVAALLAVASIPSPTRPSGWQEAQDASMPSLWQTTIERSGLEPSRWRQSEGALGRGLPGPFGVLQAWLLWPMEELEASFW
jgi:hypothetical protein